MMRFLPVALAVCLLATSALAADAPAAPVVLKSAKQGDVTFKHATHKSAKCTTCHASEKGGNMPDLHDMKKAHALCQECHKKDATKKAPVKCAECHHKAK